MRAYRVRGADFSGGVVLDVAHGPGSDRSLAAGACGLRARHAESRGPLRLPFGRRVGSDVRCVCIYFRAQCSAGTSRQRWRSGTTDAQARVEIWKETLPLTAAYRVFGSGLGSYASVFQKYRASAPEYLVDFAHNDYLQLLAESGVVGFTIAGAAVLMILMRIVRGVSAGPTTAH